MGLFARKGRAAGPAEAIAGFWTWWAGARPEVERLVEAGDTDALAAELGPRATALSPELAWDVTPGRRALYALIVSSAGDPELRPLAHRWALAAPPADALWEFLPSRPAHSDAARLTLPVAGRDFGLGELVLGLRIPNGTPRIDISAYHPIFPDLDDETRIEATLLALDSLLGEDEVARWAGDITAATAPPIDAVAAVHLPAVVADLASEYGQEQWALLEGRTGEGARLVAAARHPLRPVDHPLLDQHIAISLPYAVSDADGLPDGDSAAALGDFERRLTGLLGEVGDAALLTVHVSAEGARVLHVYADPAAEVPARVEPLASGWTEGDAHVEVADDPGWIAISPFLT
ncbi:hypothetical protein Sme01_27290 [Sphaerisporangium melleum]|uniref:DUF695 domain-containing protein n=1 Tax=Sphaerisporangium melleum TaxID=321316 RepID=A0A917VEJ1_9ACTN|nr:DUF695 domain-containing protein [Sphaerisporangium melleum]GGK70867.1 hypothetical protein GCM10007964_12050 [Sphaerisporangium melleum]GII70253.1 hypothetical protein Sme01_27290 [Sphaerisporangium melleum]